MNRREERIHAKTEADEGLVARLIAEAGPPPPAPEIEIARIQEVARAEWRRRYAWRRRERLVWRWQVAAAAVVVVGLAMVFWPTASEPERAAVAPTLAAVERLAGGAALAGPEGGPYRTLVAGDRLSVGSSVRTLDPGAETSAVALRWTDGRSLRIDAGSEVVLLAADRIELRRGALYLDSREAAVAGAPVVVTPFGRFEETGTQFEVRLGAESGTAAVRLRVREGAVMWREDGRSATAEAGVQLVLDAAGTLVRHRVAAYGPEWAWVLAAAPPPAIEGWSLARFLAWYGRESGLAVGYADAATAELARTVVVHGSVERLAAADALAAVLESTGFAARVDDGRLVAEAHAETRR